MRNGAALMNKSKIFVIIVTLTLLVGVGLSWLAFSPQLTARISQRPLLAVLLVLAVFPIYPLYLLARSWPSFALGIGLVLAALLLTICSMAGQLIGFSGAWNDAALDASEGLFFVGVVILIWQAARKKRRANIRRD